MGLLWKVVRPQVGEAERQTEKQELDLKLPSWSWDSRWGKSISFEDWHLDTSRLLREVEG